MNTNHVRLQQLLNEIQNTKLPSNSQLYELSQILQRDSQMVKQLVQFIKDSFIKRKNSEFLGNLVEIMVFLAAKSNKIFINEIHNLTFLNSVYQILADKTLSFDQKDFIVKFFYYMKKQFSNTADIYPNFGVYFRKIEALNVSIPELENRWLDYAANQQTPKLLIVDSMDQSKLSPKAQKLYQDLQIVLDHITWCNQQIDSKQIEDKSNFEKLESMRQKLLKLPNQLVQSNELVLKDYVLKILQDIQVTNEWFEWVQQGEKVQPYKSSINSLSDIEHETLKQELTLKKQKTWSQQNFDENLNIFQDLNKEEAHQKDIFQLEEADNFGKIPQKYQQQLKDDFNLLNLIEEKNDQTLKEQKFDPFDQFELIVTNQNKRETSYIKNDSKESFKNQSAIGKDKNQNDPFENIVENHLFFKSNNAQDNIVNENDSNFISQSSIPEVKENTDEINFNIEQKEIVEQEIDPFSEFK